MLVGRRCRAAMDCDISSAHNVQLC